MGKKLNDMYSMGPQPARQEDLKTRRLEIEFTKVNYIKPRFRQ